MLDLDAGSRAMLDKSNLHLGGVFRPPTDMPQVRQAMGWLPGRDLSPVMLLADGSAFVDSSDGLKVTFNLEPTGANAGL